MKVKMKDFDAAVVAFLDKVIATLPTTGHKLAAGLMLASSSGRIAEALSPLADAEGHVDTCAVRKLVTEGFSAAGGKATFTVGSDGFSWLLKPVNVTVTLQDAETAIAELEARATGAQ